ncbi:MAG: hypothetical protein GEU96_03700 [Propionibacteriales bacterium]|nr:hypothetical protein [Propionibacteriales bacterium]
MPSELQRVAQGLVDCLDQVPGVVEHLRRTAAWCRVQAAFVADLSGGNPGGRAAAMQLQAAADACDKAAHYASLAPPTARDWAMSLVGSSSAIGGSVELTHPKGVDASLVVPPATAFDPDRPPGAKPGWQSRIADDGKGRVWQDPESIGVGNGDENSMRVADPDARYTNGYVRFYNDYGQPIDLSGKPGTRESTHIARSADGSYLIPKGW